MKEHIDKLKKELNRRKITQSLKLTKSVTEKQPPPPAGMPEELVKLSYSSAMKMAIVKLAEVREDFGDVLMEIALENLLDELFETGYPDSEPSLIDDLLDRLKK